VRFRRKFHPKLERAANNEDNPDPACWPPAYWRPRSIHLLEQMRRPAGIVDLPCAVAIAAVHRVRIKPREGPRTAGRGGGGFWPSMDSCPTRNTMLVRNSGRPQGSLPSPISTRTPSDGSCDEVRSQTRQSALSLLSAGLPVRGWPPPLSANPGFLCSGTNMCPRSRSKVLQGGVRRVPPYRSASRGPPQGRPS
jgi:hypothetical protein